MQYIEKIKEDYDHLKKNGPYGTLAQDNKGGAKSQYVAAAFDEAILPYFSDAKNEKVLDFGCAAGILTNKLALKNLFSVGVDISRGMLELATKAKTLTAKQARYIQIDGMHLPFKGHQFTSVVAREALCHITDNDFPKILTEINRVLSNGGILYILDQVSESQKWRLSTHPMTIKRSILEITAQAEKVGFMPLDAYVVRQPRFFWIYLFWLGLLPHKLIRIMAKIEVRFNKHFIPIKTKRWHNVMFIFRKTNTTY